MLLGASQTWTNNSSNTLTHVASVDNPNLQLSTHTLTIAGTGNTTFASTTLQGTAAAAIIKNGAGTLTISANGSYTGTTVANGATLQLTGGISYAAEALSLTTGASGTVAIQNLSGNNTWAGTITTTGSSAVLRIGLDADLLTLSNTFTGGNAATQVVFQGNGNLLITGQLTGAVSGFTSSSTGTGIRTISNTSNDFTGNLNVNGGFVKLGASGVIPNGTGKGNVVYVGSSTGTLDLNGQAETINGLSGTTTANFVDNTAVGTAALTLGDNDATTSYAGVIRNTGGALSLVKIGSGTQTLTNTSTYTGTTTVSAGVLQVTGSIGTSNVTVNGGVLASGATGTVGNNVTVNNNAALAANGTAVGVASVVTDLNFSSGSIFDWTLTTGSGDGTFDTVSVGGALNITSGAKFNVASSTAFTDTFWDATHTWSNIFGAKLIDNFLAANFLYSGSVTAPSAEGSFTVSGSNLTWTAVPEPSSALAGLLLAAGLLRRRRA